MKSLLLFLASLSVLVGLSVLHLSPKALADPCDTCNPGGCGMGTSIAGTLFIDGSRHFSDTGNFGWCIINFEGSIGACEFVTAESVNVNDVVTTPAFLDPSGCAGSFSVSVEGDLNDENEAGTCTIRSFVWSPTCQHKLSIAILE